MKGVDNMLEFRKLVTLPGEVIDFETVFEENPLMRTGVPTKPGKVERLDYTTTVYGDQVFNKTAYVYLPFGYDPEDKEKKYNVLYFQHGNTCEPAMFAVGGNKPMFDMLFENSKIDPCIIVFITYYMNPMGDAEQRTFGGQAPAGDGQYESIPGLYYREVVEDIVPAVELKYNTYLTEGTDEAIKATRDHRCFAGYSRGSAMTWRMIHYDLEYFRWFCPMSCFCWGDEKAGTILSEEDAINYVTAGMRAHPELPFFIFASNGYKNDVVPMNTQMKYLTKAPGFSFGPDPEKNNIYFALSDFYHTDYLVPYYLWNSMKVVFKGI